MAVGSDARSGCQPRFHNGVAARVSRTDFVTPQPGCASVVTGPVMEPNSVWVVVGVGRVDTTTSGRVRRWDPDRVGPPVGVGLGGGPATPGSGCARRCR